MKEEPINEYAKQLIDAFNEGYELGVETAKQLYK